MLFGGPPKIGKTFVATSLARSLSVGERLFESPLFWTPEVARVLLIEQELGEAGLKKRVVPVFRDLEPKKYADNLWYVSKIPELLLDQPDGRKILWDLVEAVQPNVVILDPMGQIHQYDENDNTAVGKLFSHFEQLKADFKKNDLSLVISHHFGKPLRGRDAESYDPLDPQNFRGSSRWFGNPDTIVTFDRGKNLKTFHTAWELRARFTLRHGEELPDMLLTVNEKQDLRVRYHGGTKAPVLAKPAASKGFSAPPAAPTAAVPVVPALPAPGKSVFQPV